MRGDETGWGSHQEQQGLGWRCMTKHVQGAHPGDRYQQHESKVHSGGRGRAGDQHSCNIGQGGAELKWGSWAPAVGGERLGQWCHWTYSSAEPVRQPKPGYTGTSMRFDLRSETSVAGPTPSPKGK